MWKNVGKCAIIIIGGTTMSCRKDSLYFVEKPMARQDEDLIGISKQVKYVENGIKNGAKFIGITSKFATGKSSITNSIKVKGYKIIRVNLWREKDVDICELHKDFLYQLAMQTPKVETQYLTDRYSNDGKKINIVSKSKGFLNYLILTIVFGVLLWLLGKEQIRNFLCEHLETFDFFTQNVQNVILGVLGIIFICLLTATIYQLIKHGFLVSYWETDTNKFTKNEMLELYNSILRGHKKHIIIIEDLDRSDNKNLEADFIRDLYALYNKSNKKNVFIIECGIECLKDTKLDIKKIFNIILECGDIDFTNTDVKLLNSLLDTKKDPLRQIGIDISDEDIKWELLSLGTDVTIRKIKHRYNDAILRYETLKSRFCDSKIDINMCMVISYLRDEYCSFSEEQIESKIKEIFQQYEVGERSVAEEPIDKDVISFVKQEIINEEYNRYIKNYPSKSVYRTTDEANIYNIVYKDDKESLKKSVNCLNKIKELKCIVKEAVDRRNKIYTGIPEVLLEHEILFDIVMSDDQLKENLVSDFIESDLERKAMFIAKTIDYNSSKDFLGQVLLSEDIATNEFREELFKYPKVIANIEKIRKLFIDIPISDMEIKRIKNVGKILILISVLKDKDTQIERINQIYNNLQVTERDNFKITLYVDDLKVTDGINDKEQEALLFINMITYNSYQKETCAVWLNNNMSQFEESTVQKIVDMLNKIIVVDCEPLVELLITVAQRGIKYGMNLINSKILLEKGYQYEYLICNGLYIKIINDVQSIPKSVYVRVFKEYYDGENLKLSEGALKKIFNEKMLKDISWTKLKAFVGVIANLALYIKMVDLAIEGEKEAIDYFDRYTNLSQQNELKLIKYICENVNSYDNFMLLKNKIYNKLGKNGKSKLTKKANSWR